MKEIVCTNGPIAFVDDEDYDALKNYAWYASKQKGNNTTYVRRNRNKLKEYMHRVILGLHRGALI